MSKKLRTPIIKPRTQGGTFYTFGSALEDIGLNINESSNRIELSHYVLLNIPEFNDSSVFGVKTWSKDSSFNDVPYPGDYIFAEAFENYTLNKETTIQNSDSYDFSKSQTISEEVFWSWVFKDSSLLDTSKFAQMTNNGLTYYTEVDSSVAVAFGRISASSQRTDDYGIYNESFVQIPSSYGRMRILFKNNTNDPNFLINNSYIANTYIENITPDEIDSSTNKLWVTGIDARSICDVSTGHIYTSDKALTVELDINKLQTFYDQDDLTYDDIGMNKINLYPYPDASRDFKFNAILVYYSIYNADGSARFATNAYGIYILNNSIIKEEDDDWYSFPSLSKKASTATEDGTAFSFRLNIKPTSVYSGDVQVYDNSTEGFGNATNFDGILRNLAKATDILRANTSYIGQLVNVNKTLNNIVLQMTTKINELQGKVYDLETRVANLEHN